MFCKIVSLICTAQMLIFVLLHDWINLYPFNDLKTLNRHCSLRNKILMTITNVPFIAIYLGILLTYWSAPFSFHAKFYLIACNILFLIGISYSWYLPYIFGWPEQQVKELNQMYQSTHRFLPRIGSNPTPNTLHVIFHIVLLINLITTFLMF